MKKIKISDAKEISKKTDFDMVLVIGIDADRSGFISTYGKTKALCKLAGHIGQKELGTYLFGETGLLANMPQEKAVAIVEANTVDTEIGQEYK